MDKAINTALSVEFEAERTPVRLGKSNRYFYIDLNDINFPLRVLEIRDEIERFLKAKQFEAAVNSDVEDTDTQLSIIKSADDFIKERLNYAFGYDVSSDVFGTASSVSVTASGDYYFNSFLNSLLPLLKSQYDIRLKGLSERAKLYTDRKGQHTVFGK